MDFYILSDKANSKKKKVRSRRRTRGNLTLFAMKRKFFLFILIGTMLVIPAFANESSLPVNGSAATTVSYSDHGEYSLVKTSAVQSGTQNSSAAEESDPFQATQSDMADLSAGGSVTEAVPSGSSGSGQDSLSGLTGSDAELSSAQNGSENTSQAVSPAESSVSSQNDEPQNTPEQNADSQNLSGIDTTGTSQSAISENESTGNSVEKTEEELLNEVSEIEAASEEAAAEEAVIEEAEETVGAASARGLAVVIVIVAAITAAVVAVVIILIRRLRKK